jgi:hypothetical protein
MAAPVASCLANVLWMSGAARWMRWLGSSVLRVTEGEDRVEDNSEKEESDGKPHTFTKSLSVGEAKNKDDGYVDQWNKQEQNPPPFFSGYRH